MYKLNSRVIDCAWPAFRLARLPHSAINKNHSELELVTFVRVKVDDVYYLQNLRVRESISPSSKTHFYEIQDLMIRKARIMAEEMIHNPVKPERLSAFFQIDAWQQDEELLIIY